MWKIYSTLTGAGVKAQLSPLMGAKAADKALGLAVRDGSFQDDGIIIETIGDVESYGEGPGRYFSLALVN